MTAPTDTLPSFELDDSAGTTHVFPSGKKTLLCFVKEDCPTCDMSMPLIEQVHRAYGESIDVLAVGQDTPGNAILVERHGLSMPMLDDDALGVSFRYDLDTVPTVILADESGAELRRFIGFGREDWRSLVAELAGLTALDEADVDWGTYPDSRPGCGSRSVEPGIAERLQAESEGSPLRARRIDIATHDDEAEFLFDQGLTDGLPVVPPTPARVLRMLAGTKRDAQEEVAIVPPNLAPCTVEKIAINAVMAGCRPEYLPVVIASVEAACNDEFNAHGVMATTMGASPGIIVNGPIRHRIGMNMQLGALGQGNRANASIGRALRLILRNVGGARPGGTERSTLGNPMKFTMCYAEYEEASDWKPLHVERGFEPEDNVVTLYAFTGGPSYVIDQQSRTARAVAGSMAARLGATWHPSTRPLGDTMLVVCPEHLGTIRAEGWTKDDLRQHIFEASSKPLREVLAGEDGAGVPPQAFGPNGPSEEQLNEKLPKFVGPEYIHITVAGSGAGMFSAMFEGWAFGSIGSQPVSRKITD
jgi:thiol-disulfide isomerase/thioredoxin